jgi:iron complex outermembrane receptor protein
MDQKTLRRSAALSFAVAAALAASVAGAQATGGSSQAQELEQIVVTGTRVQDRSVLETVAPVDVVSAESLQQAGVTELNQSLAIALPSYNFPRPGLADGTDTIRPATLRGLAPDQTLVLVNSKRRHAASLVNVNGTVGRGSAAVDLNTIPSAIVNSIEVLRDGASAQYGSDAIAGVINVRLREESSGGDLSTTYGWRDTKYETLTPPPPAGATWTVPARAERSASDGETLTVSGWKGLPLGESGFVTIAGEYKDQARTERDGIDSRQQYPRLANGQFDPREQTIDRYNAWYGEPELEQLTLFANAGYDFANGAKGYGWASFQDRDARSAGFFRRALQDQNIISIYPDGYLPIIAPAVKDYSAGAGVKWKLASWDMDTSLVYGRNEMDFTIENTLNRSIGPTSKTEFDAGGFEYDQLVFNFSGVKSYDMGLASPLNVAAGLEARRETYAINAGEPDSWRNGGVLLPNGSPAPSGAQVFPGFRPSNELDESRTAVGAYVDVEANLTDELLGSAAVRAEHYSDFGESFAGKLALRYDFTESFALRGSVQNGFRAPSLQQQFFTTTSTNFINVAGQGQVPFEITTFPATDPVAAALGAQPLDAEESVNFSLGAVMRFDRATLTLDAYHIKITDRIVLSENLTQQNVRDFLASQGFIGIGGGRFFINGVDTTTKGLDVVFSVPFAAGAAGEFDFTATANFNDTSVDKVPTTNQLSSLNPPPPLFARVNVLTFEEGTPGNKYAAQLGWKMDRFGATLRATRYGEVLSPATSNNPVDDVVLGAKTLVDLEARVSITDHVKLAIGGENLTDEYPDPTPVNVNTSGNTPFSNYSPFGRSGRYWYGRVSITF